MSSAGGDLDYYEILGVERAASTTDIRKAYRRLALRHHPDKCDGQDDGEMFKLINEAYEVLSDDEKRRTYDRFGYGGLQGGADGHGFPHRDPHDLFQEIFGDGCKLACYQSTPPPSQAKHISPRH
eukprot:m.95487 g.95487  ORF g.95487 m.95487 type:complete len:125 (+) comp13058_c0_seq20:542-916(+)